jgi:hypothetical protein
VQLVTIRILLSVKQASQIPGDVSDGYCLSQQCLHAGACLCRLIMDFHYHFGNLF